MKYLAVLCVLALPFPLAAQDHARHDAVKNAIGNIKAAVDTTVTVTHTIIGNVGDPIPGCVGRVCGGSITDPIPGK